MLGDDVSGNVLFWQVCIKTNNEHMRKASGFHVLGNNIAHQVSELVVNEAS